MSRFHLAQANVARTKGSYDDPVMAGFVARLDPLNALADQAPGFVWRLIEEDGDDTAARLFGDTRVLFNMSVWESVGALEQYVYRTDHVEAVRRRAEWMEPLGGLPFVLWWIPAGHIPDIAEARDRFGLLWDKGPSAEAFTFRQRFEPTGMAV